MGVIVGGVREEEEVKGEERMGLEQELELKSMASEIQEEMVRLEDMFNGAVSTLFEYDSIHLEKKDTAIVEKMKVGCLRRYNMTEKMIMNELEEMDEQN